jgi:hypothetical protein
MRVDLEGFADVAEAREAAKHFLRETKPPKGSGPLAMYDSYVRTSGPSSVQPPSLRERFSALARRWSSGSGARRD